MKPFTTHHRESNILWCNYKEALFDIKAKLRGFGIFNIMPVYYH